DHLDTKKRVVGYGISGHRIVVGALPEIDRRLVRFGIGRRAGREYAQGVLADADQIVGDGIAMRPASQNLDTVVVVADDIAADRVSGRLQLDAHGIAVRRPGLEVVQPDDVVDDGVVLRSAAGRNRNAAPVVAWI